MTFTRTFLVAIFVLFAASASAQEFASHSLRKGETVSHASMFLTRNGNNWKKATVVNPKTGRTYKTASFRRLPVGTEVRFASAEVKTRPVSKTSPAEACKNFTNADCVAVVSRINRASADAVIDPLYVPKDFTKAAVAPPVDVCANLEGAQAAVPQGMVSENGSCVVPEQPKKSNFWAWTMGLLAVATIAVGSWFGINFSKKEALRLDNEWAGRFKDAFSGPLNHRLPGSLPPEVDVGSFSATNQVRITPSSTGVFPNLVNHARNTREAVEVALEKVGDKRFVLDDIEQDSRTVVVKFKRGA